MSLELSKEQIDKMELYAKNLKLKCEIQLQDNLALLWSCLLLTSANLIL